MVKKHTISGQKISFIFSTFLFSQLISAQSNKISECDKLLANNKIAIERLQSENLYYKETLDLLKPVRSGTDDNLKFEIIKVTGNKNGKSLIVEYTVTNISDAERENYSPQNSYMIDPRGNSITTMDFKMTGKQKGIDQLQPNIPIRGSIDFKIEETGFPMIKLLNIKFSNINRLKDGLYSTIHFENLPVTWN